MNRLDRLFAALTRAPRPALSIYLPAGYPDLATSHAAMMAALEAGADWLEVGIPFSDPAADGPTIAAATQKALRNGVRLADCLDIARRVRATHPDAPLVAMTYANIAYRVGIEAFMAQLAKAGFDGCILADVPLEESAPFAAACRTHDLAWIPLVTPTTQATRMAAIAKTGSGFLYVVGNVGTTGQDDPGLLLESTVATARQATDLPLAVGFGISTADDVRRVHDAGAQAAIVGSAAVRALAEGVPALRDHVAALRGDAP